LRVSFEIFLFHSENLIIPFSDNNIAIGRVTSIWANTIFIITMSGTDKSIHIGPHKVPQKISDIRITKGLRFSLFPISLGSIKFQTSTCAATINIKNTSVRYNESNCTREKSTGKLTAIIDQTLGI